MPARMMTAAAIVVVALAVGITAGCTSNDEPPPRSPLGESPAPATPVATTPASPTPTLPPAATATPATGSSEAPTQATLEAFTGNAIELMAEWLGVPATDLAVEEAEALVWPDGCLGVEEPGVACTQALAPGFRVVLRDDFDGLHRVHASADGRVVRWAGERVVTGAIVASTRDALTIATTGGDVTVSRSRGALYRGSMLRGGYDDMAALATDVGGRDVAVAVDPSPLGDTATVIAWLAVIE